MWYVAKGLQIIGLGQVLIGFFVGVSQDDLASEYKIALVGVIIFLLGRLVEKKFTRG